MIGHGCKERIFVFWRHFFYISICFPPPLCLKISSDSLFFCIWEIWKKLQNTSGNNNVLLGVSIYSTSFQLDAQTLSKNKGNEMGCVTIWQGIKSHTGNCGNTGVLTIGSNLSVFNESRLKILISFIVTSQIQRVLRLRNCFQ